MPIKVLFVDVLGVLDLNGSRNSTLIDLLETAKQQSGLKIVITTNTSLSSENDPLGIAAVADLVINSSPSTPKPSSSFWSLCFSQAKDLVPDLETDQVLVIDDRSDIIISAQEFGLQTLHYRPGVSEQDIEKQVIKPDQSHQSVTFSSPEEIDSYFNKLN